MVTKEKTAKIFPNAIAVTMADKKLLFTSFLSREAAFRLMVSVWQPAVAVVARDPESESGRLNLEITVECSTEDEYSSEVSDDSNTESVPLRVQESITSLTATTESSFVSEPIDGVIYVNKMDATDASNGNVDTLTLASSTTAAVISIHEPGSTPPLPPRPPVGRFPKIHFLADIRPLYIGVVFAVLFSLLSGFLFFRPVGVEAETAFNRNYNPFDVKGVSEKVGDTVQICLRNCFFFFVFQKNASENSTGVCDWMLDARMQTKNFGEAEIILNAYLEHISKVRILNGKLLQKC